MILFVETMAIQFAASHQPLSLEHLMEKGFFADLGAIQVS